MASLNTRCRECALSPRLKQPLPQPEICPQNPILAKGLIYRIRNLPAFHPPRPAAMRSHRPTGRIRLSGGGLRLHRFRPAQHGGAHCAPFAVREAAALAYRLSARGTGRDGIRGAALDGRRMRAQSGDGGERSGAGFRCFGLSAGVRQPPQIYGCIVCSADRRLAVADVPLVNQPLFKNGYSTHFRPPGCIPFDTVLHGEIYDSFIRMALFQTPFQAR